MANLVRHVLTIEGPNVRRVLDAIGFNPSGVHLGPGTDPESPDLAVVIDFDRIVPRPAEKPEEGWEKWIDRNWGSLPYDGYSDGDVFELTESQSFVQVLYPIDARFPGH